jgi:hypothetical protein
MQGANKKITSDGFNILGNIGQSVVTSEFTLQPSDVTAYYADIFGSNVLADNGGYPQTVALTAQRTGATVEQLDAFKAGYQITVGDIAKDQRGFSRNAAGAVSIGAYEHGASGGTGTQTVPFDKYIVYPTAVSESVTVAGAEGAHISIISVSGVQLYAINKAKDVEYISLANYPKGIYFVAVNGKTTKIVK